MLTELLKEDGGQWLIPLAIVAAGVVLVKGVFGFSRSRSQDRKDFLDLWAKADKADDLWLQVAVRHLFGETLPPALIRRFLVHPQGARAIGDLAFSWPFLDMDDTSGELRWRSDRHYSKRARRWEWGLWMTTYVIVALAMFAFAGLAALSGKSFMGLCLWVLAVEAGIFAVRALFKAERLSDANEFVPRWTRDLRWKRGGPDAAPVRSSKREAGQKGRRARSG